MNSAKWQETRLTFKHPLHVFTLTMKYQKGNAKKKIPFKIAPKIKYLGINLTKEVKDL